MIVLLSKFSWFYRIFQFYLISSSNQTHKSESNEFVVVGALAPVSLPWLSWAELAVRIWSFSAVCRRALRLRKRISNIDWTESYKQMQALKNWKKIYIKKWREIRERQKVRNQIWIALVNYWYIHVDLYYFGRFW